MNMTRELLLQLWLVAWQVPLSPPAGWPQARRPQPVTCTGSRAVCRRFVLVGSDREAPGARAGCHCRTNPLTTLPEAVASLSRARPAEWPDCVCGAFVLGMIVTEAGVHPNVSALVYVAARAPDAGEDYTALAKTFKTPPASAGIVFDGDEGRLSEAAFCAISPATCPRRRRECSMPCRRLSGKRCLLERRRTPPGVLSPAFMRYRPRIGRSTRTSSGSWPSVWARRPSS